MGYRNLKECVDDLARSGQLVRIDAEIDPRLEAAEIQRRVCAAGGPAIYFARVKGCKFPMVSNLFGTIERTRFMFRDALAAVRHLIELKIEPAAFFKHPLRYRDVLKPAWSMRPRRCRSGPVLQNRATVDQLPQLVSWPDDGGAFITLPMVYTEDAHSPGLARSNLGMYRVQMSGGRYKANQQVGLHYQIHRSIGVHHATAIEKGVPFRANVFVGGSPAMILAAVMPLPEGLSELMFAGALGRRPVPMISRSDGLPIYAEADFCITGTVDPELVLPEGPFGDHLGYYSLTHDFPVLNVENVYHRDGAIWPFTVVGRPPQEDTSFGKIIHELTGPIIPSVVAGVKAVHAVDAAGVHPLLLAVGSERYVPYTRDRKPQELLTQAHALLGQGQLSLAKYLLIVAHEDDPGLDVEDIPAFFAHVLSRVDWRNDLHFETRTTIDTLDYSGTGLNAGSKLVIAAAGPVKRELPAQLPSTLPLPEGFSEPRLGGLPGVLVVQGPRFSAGPDGIDPAVSRFCRHFDASHPVNRFPLIVLVDDSEFAARTLNNLLWVTFTRSNPAADVDGIGAFMHQKHWGCEGSLVIDARIKPQHAPPLIEDPAVSRRVDRLAAPGGPLHGIL
ncbi:MAG: UbiD family decarboxylase [Planctomycetaceae bacterium]